MKKFDWAPYLVCLVGLIFIFFFIAITAYLDPDTSHLVGSLDLDVAENPEHELIYECGMCGMCLFGIFGVLLSCAFDLFLYLLKYKKKDTSEEVPE